jgi:hypothetical protein
VSTLEVVVKAPEVIGVPFNGFGTFTFGAVAGFVVGDKVRE